LALSQTCYAYSYSLSDTVTDTTSTTSVVFRSVTVFFCFVLSSR
jgi:hypothetical protein